MEPEGRMEEIGEIEVAELPEGGTELIIYSKASDSIASDQVVNIEFPGMSQEQVRESFERHLGRDV